MTTSSATGPAKVRAWATSLLHSKNRVQAALSLYEALKSPRLTGKVTIARVVETEGYTVFDILVDPPFHLNLVSVLKLTPSTSGPWTWERQIREPVLHRLTLTGIPEKREPEKTPNRFNLTLRFKP